MSIRRSGSFQKHIDLILLGVATLLPVFVYAILGPNQAVKSVYIPLGTFVAFVCIRQDLNIDLLSASHSNLFKLQLIFYLIAISILGISNNQLYSLVLILFMMVPCLMLQIQAGVPSQKIVVQIGLLATVIPLSAFLTTGMYFGNVDPLWQHFGNVKSLIQSGGVNSISNRWTPFPGMVILAGIVAEIADTNPYHSSMYMLSILSFSFVAAFYMFFNTYTKETVAALASLAFVGMHYSSFQVTVFFPQTFAMLLSIIVLGILFKPSKDISWRDLTVALLIAMGLVLIHHATIIITFLFALSLIMVQFVYKPFYNNTERIGGKIALLTVGIFSISYWTFRGEVFIHEILFFVPRLLQSLGGFIIGDTTSVNTVLLYGVTTSDETFWEAVGFIFSVKGVYFIVLSACLVLAAVQYTGGVDYRTAILLTVGFLGSIFILPSPLSGMRGVARSGFLVSGFSAFAVAIGLTLLKRDNDKFQSTATILLILIVVLGPIVGFGFSPFYDGAGTGHDPQRSFSKGELAELTAATDFGKSSDEPISTFWVTSEYIEYIGGETSQLEVSSTQIAISDGLYLQRDSWSSKKATQHDPLAGKSVRFSKGMLSGINNKNNKVFSGGEVTMLYCSEDCDLINVKSHRNTSSPS